MENISDTILAPIGLIYIVLSWIALNYFIDRLGIVFFGNLNGFMQLIFLKFIFSMMLGCILIPLMFIHKALTKPR